MICLCLIINVNYAVDSNCSDLNISREFDEFISVDETENLSKSYSVNGGSFSDIREVISKASSGDTIKLSGKFLSDGKIINVDKKLVFTSSNGVTFDGRSKSGIFYLKTNAKGSSFYNFKFINGKRSVGSAVFVNCKDVTFDKCLFENNHGTDNGGGAFATGWDKDIASGLTIQNCIFKANSAPASSGAVAAFSTNFKIINCIFEDNYASNNVGRTAYEGALQTGMMGTYGLISGCTFKNNYAISDNKKEPSRGGAIGIRSGTTVENCYFENNYADYGGAITFFSSGVVKNCIFKNNEADYGGAIGTLTDNFREISIYNSYFESNNAIWGGAIDLSGNKILLDNSTFNLNKAQFGGALTINDANTIISKCIFQENYAESGGAVNLIGENQINLTFSNFILNSANFGGAIYSSNSNFTCYSLNFTNNSAFLFGGAMVIDGNNTSVFKSNFINNSAKYAAGIQINSNNARLYNSIFLNNIATIDGGAVNINGNNIKIIDSDFSLNQAIYGGAIKQDAQNCSFYNLNFYNNSALYGGALFVINSSDLFLYNNSLFNNKAFNGSAIYNNASLNIISSKFFENKAKSYILTANNISVKKHDTLLIKCYYECGDNLLDAIYNNGIVSIENKSVFNNNGCINQKIYLLINNITYESYTNNEGFVLFKLSTDDFKIGNFTYFVGHEEDELYSEIFNSSNVEVLNKEKSKEEYDSNLKENGKTKKDKNKNNIVSENTKLSSVSSSSFLRNVHKNSHINEFYPIKKETYQNCGAKVLRELLASKGIYVDLNVLINKLNSKDGQTSMYDIIRVAKEYGVKLYANKLNISELNYGDIVLICINGKNHFVTIKSMDNRYIFYNDPDVGEVKISIEEFNKLFTGYSLSEKTDSSNISENLILLLIGGSLPILINLLVNLDSKFRNWSKGSKYLNSQAYPRIYNFEQGYNRKQDRKNKINLKITMNSTKIPQTIGRTKILQNGSFMTKVNGKTIIHDKVLKKIKIKKIKIKKFKFNFKFK